MAVVVAVVVGVVPPVVAVVPPGNAPLAEPLALLRAASICCCGSAVYSEENHSLLLVHDELMRSRTGRSPRRTLLIMRRVSGGASARNACRDVRSGGLPVLPSIATSVSG